ncbi:alpha-1,6-mannosyl-glycoprotein 2-beta-N-acetylglucosaminyltransferase isoform X7 [Neodiprion virginianus]|nr:alpha-1,6-mannosyl-glycoprotein 2-beta-N-acetylglucosaminyltransferase isoform X7 [Neodiprion fabricii]XP_046432724.1 alpha-1,6-mannosyl-glycoprotein 2-beta-N-acetylglucosaminyltransferase isoform X8 [Neodiprion fabricii]XP_046600306.1 alpha-1,6-mannosyl-glycoprotein 2-beta-N-acetylglucosaminyltransferase isoform X7 [Neodiprion lecontei]XP_046600307.1 alpha-1,6-mannosyl-glycoprotein 2-beta-N-acetylglucosaminyltransferase isoform X8 [Neodiprion lecontei]XP_046626546.1 alpha-1,6-mannosyl-glyco
MRVSGVAVMGGGRNGRGTLVRTLALVFLATLLWLQFHVASLTSRSSSPPSGNESLLMLVPQELHRFLKDRRNSTAGSNSTAGISGNLTISELRRQVEKANLEQRVFNEEAFGPLASDAPVIVIQVHARLTYLRHLIVSLAQAKGIEQTLLIFSHDVWDPDINFLVQSVDFCRVMQIFYPYSIQTHPHTFPGEDPNDCPRNIKRESALVKKCINAEHPDLYGHYREAKFTQTKHHWWWKANRVFDQLTVTKNHVGMVLFLEEDHYVAEDFLHVLRLMERTCKHSCERCNILSLGTYLKTYNYYADNKKFLGVNGVLQKEMLRGLKRHNGIIQGGFSTYQGAQLVQAAAPAWAFQLLPNLYNHYQKAEVTPWISSKHNMGMAFNRITWNKLRDCASKFCSYDDYNWDWSLQHIAQGCIPSSQGSGGLSHIQSGLIAMVMKAPRIFHIGE